MEVRLKNAPNVPRLGDDRRVPNYSYTNWGLKLGAWREKSKDLYRVEWEEGSPRQVKHVIEATKQAGFEDYTQMLRDINAKTVAYLVETSKDKVYYLEPGAGISTVNLYQRLFDKGIDVDKIYVTMVEPSRKRLENAVEELKKWD